MSFVSYAQNLEDVMLWRALRDVEAGFYIDIGAHDPEFHSVTMAFYERGWRGINAEPVPSYSGNLAARRPRDVNLCVAVGSEVGTVPFHEINATGLSTLSSEIANRHGENGFSVSLRQVEMNTLAQICAAHAPDDIHFLKIDVEGAERDVLVGADLQRFRPWIILVEATEPTSRKQSHHDWEPLILEAGYAFVWFDGLNRFYVASERMPQLSSHFQLPPNVFDDYIRSPGVEPASVEEIKPVVTALYRSLLLRDPDQEGLNTFASIAAERGTVEPVVVHLLTSQEFAGKFTDFCSRYSLPSRSESSDHPVEQQTLPERDR